MKYIKLIFLFFLSCTEEKVADLEFTSFKKFIYYKGDSLEKEYSKIYMRQGISFFDSALKTENILDSIYFLDSNSTNKSYFNNIDTIEFQRGNRKERIIAKNQNKYHYELKEKNNAISFEKISYPMPFLDDENPPNNIDKFNRYDFRVYTIGSKVFKIYCFGYLDMCDDCNHVVYFSKEFGEIATYSIDWGHLIIIDSITNKKNLENLRKIILKLKNDKQFFPNPKGLKHIGMN